VATKKYNPEEQKWPKKNPAITGKHWDLEDVGKVTSYDTVQQHRDGTWIVEYMVGKTMTIGFMPLDEFFDKSTLLSPWLGKRVL
jgi:hypothetical protein